MQEGKHKRKKVQILEIYSVLILIATILMSIGYAEITGVDLSVTTNVESTAQEGVFITDITRTEYDGADITASKINSYIDTTMNSTVVLGGSGSYITYNVSVYNKTDREQVFIGPFSITGEGLYDNSLITYELGGLEPYETVLQPGKNSYFTITFKYAGSDTSKNTLTSKINFRFMEVPELAVTNEGEITGIYPGYTPKEYEFTVSNYNGETVNNVALSYGLTATVQEPFIAKIYDANGTEVTSNTVIDVEGKDAETGTSTKVNHTYKLKIMWDNTNPENGVVYNSTDYANKTYTAKINVTGTPKPNADGVKKYEDYQLTESKDVTVKTAPLYFGVEPSGTTIEMTNNRAELNLVVSNNDGSSTNPYDTKYTISQDNSDFVLYVDETAYTNNITGERTISGNLANIVEKIWLVPNETSTLEKEENINMTIVTTSPYTKTETIQIKVTDTTPPTAPTITGGGEEFVTSQTISVSEASTDVGTGVQNYEYLVNNTGEAIADASGNVGNTATETSKTFNTDYNGYYIWFRAVDKVGNKGAWSNSQMLNIDTTPPSAPTITGGNTSDTYATSVTINVDTESIDELSGVDYYEYYQTSETTAPTASSEGIKLTTSETTQIFNTNMAGNYVYFRAVDKVGNRGEWSNAERVYVDTVSPTVTANKTSLDITAGTSNTFDSLFTATTGTGGLASVTKTYKLNDETTIYTNTSELAAGTYTLTCTASKTTGKTASESITITVKIGLTTKQWTTAGTYSWTCPAGITSVKVAVCGGGGGGSCDPVASRDKNTRATPGDGGDSSFGALITAEGGTGWETTFDCEDYVYSYIITGQRYRWRS